MPPKKSKKKADPKVNKKVRLGRGLDALLSGIDSMESSSAEYFQCDIDLIQPNRFQPRIRFSENELNDLCQSIKEQGIIQPLLVRKHEDGYELVAGERRLRASKLAGLSQLPVIVRDISDVELLEISIVENIQREDLNPMEEADAYHRLMSEFSLTQDNVSNRVGKSRSAVANFLRLRQLPGQIQTTIKDGSLSMGHARALLGLKTPAKQNAAWKSVISKKLSVRETESLVKRLQNENVKPKKKTTHTDDIYFQDLADDLSRQFGTRVKIIRKGKKGKVEIDFFSNDDLDRLISLLKSEN